MMRSMTGYGRGSSAGDYRCQFVVEIRAVNHRYADFLIRLPRELYFLEEKVRRLLAREIKRGRLEVGIAMKTTAAGLFTVEVNRPLAEAYYRSLEELARLFSLPASIPLEFLGGLPDVLSVQGEMPSEEEVWPPLQEALEEALEQLIRRREEEGKNLAADLDERCRAISAAVRLIAERAPAIQEEHRRRLEQKFKEMLTGQLEENRLLMEAALLAERMDINEELVRLQSHLEAFIQTMSGPGPWGRRLDFIAQEMFREINAVGSKSADYWLTSQVIAIKSELDKMREQIQNIE